MASVGGRQPYHTISHQHLLEGITAFFGHPEVPEVLAKKGGRRC